MHVVVTTLRPLMGVILMSVGMYKLGLSTPFWLLFVGYILWTGGDAQSKH